LQLAPGQQVFWPGPAFFGVHDHAEIPLRPARARLARAVAAGISAWSAVRVDPPAQFGASRYRGKQTSVATQTFARPFAHGLQRVGTVLLRQLAGAGRPREKSHGVLRRVVRRVDHARCSEKRMRWAHRRTAATCMMAVVAVSLLRGRLGPRYFDTAAGLRSSPCDADGIAPDSGFRQLDDCRQATVAENDQRAARSGGLRPRDKLSRSSLTPDLQHSSSASSKTIGADCSGTGRYCLRLDRGRPKAAGRCDGRFMAAPRSKAAAFVRAHPTANAGRQERRRCQHLQPRPIFALYCKASSRRWGPTIRAKRGGQSGAGMCRLLARTFCRMARPKGRRFCQDRSGH